MKALVVHPRFSAFGGGEYVALNVIHALREAGHRVSLMSQDYDADAVRKAFHFDEPADQTLLPPPADFSPKIGKAIALQRVIFARQGRKKTALIYRDFDLIFHTQTSCFLGPPVNRTFNIFYDPSDIIRIRTMTSGRSPTLVLGPQWKRPYYTFCKSIIGNPWRIEAATNIPLSSDLESYLETNGFNHTDYVYPPCDMSFKPRPKKRRVIQTTRIAPHKRLEDFLAVARRVPECDFIIVGSVSSVEKRHYPGYAEKLVNDLPNNVKYVESRIRDCPEVLEDSSVYLYTSRESGINISTAQAVGAGCTPVTPDVGGGAELVRAVGAGYTYDSIDQAVRCVKQALEHPRNPSELSKIARIFSAESFRERIRKLVA